MGIYFTKKIQVKNVLDAKNMSIPYFHVQRFISEGIKRSSSLETTTLPCNSALTKSSESGQNIKRGLICRSVPLKLKNGNSNRSHWIKAKISLMSLSMSCSHSLICLIEHSLWSTQKYINKISSWISLIFWVSYRQFIW